MFIRLEVLYMFLENTRIKIAVAKKVVLEGILSPLTIS